MKITVFVVKDFYGNVNSIVARMEDAIAKATELEVLDSFEDFVDNWMSDNSADDLFDLLDEKNPKDFLYNEWLDNIRNDIEDGSCEYIEAFEVDIPFDSLDLPNLAPEVLVLIANIFKS